MGNRAPFAVDEWYHCYNRGVDKRTTFESDYEYKRFIELLYLSNSDTPIRRSDQSTLSFAEVFTLPRSEPLVAIGAYCLMPNHFHLLLKDLSEEGGGISRFMQKLGTAYTMYFNMSRERTGNLFIKPFRSKHISSDEYLKRVTQYIHFNPIELFEPGWKEGRLKSPDTLMTRLREYPYSSLADFQPDSSRPEGTVVDKEMIEILQDETFDLQDTLSDMAEYYRELAK